MDAVTIRKAKSTLSQLLVRVESGEGVVLARGSQPVARIVPYRAADCERQPGALRGLITVGPELSDPLPEGELAEWE